MPNDTTQLTSRPIRLTESQARQAIADRISVPNLEYQIGQLKTSVSDQTKLAVLFSNENISLKQQAVVDDATIRKHKVQIFWLKVERLGLAVGGIFLLAKQF